jgi:RNA polymerase sigma-70 factor (ECF subfamily)
VSPHQEFVDAALPHVDVVWSLARRLTEGQAAEDLVQETFLRAFAGFASHRGGDLRPWLVSICLNAARSDARRRRRRPQEDLEADPAKHLPSPSQVDADVIAAAEREEISAALGQLSEPQRQSILLVDLAGLTAQEAADVLGAPRGTVLARVHRGRRRLAQLLVKEEVDRDA